MEKKMTTELFKEIYTSDILDKVEKINGGSFSLTYMSWTEAWKQAMEIDAEATFEVLEAEDGFPLFSRGELHFVKTRVTLLGKTQQCHLPIMDNKHNAVKNPNGRQVNDGIQRCLTKNLALFGIGLALYNGEDLSQFKVKTPRDTYIEDIQSACDKKEIMAIYKGYAQDIGKKLSEMNLGELETLTKKIGL